MADGLHGSVDFGQEGGSLPLLDALNAECIVTQVPAPELLPERRTRLAKAVSLGHKHIDSAAGDAVVPLAGEAGRRSVRLAVGAEPDGIDFSVRVPSHAASCCEA